MRRSETMHGIEEIRDMVEVLTAQGEYFHGGFPEEVAVEWLDAGIESELAKKWMNAWVWQASVATALSDMGKRPIDLGELPDGLVYAWCNGDKSVEWPEDE